MHSNFSIVLEDILLSLYHFAFATIVWAMIRTEFNRLELLERLGIKIERKEFDFADAFEMTLAVVSNLSVVSPAAPP